MIILYNCLNIGNDFSTCSINAGVNDYSRLISWSFHSINYVVAMEILYILAKVIPYNFYV